MKLQTFIVQLSLREVTVSVNVSAASLEEAILKGKALRVGADILQKDVTWDDGDGTVVGVFGS